MKIQLKQTCLWCEKDMPRPFGKYLICSKRCLKQIPHPHSYDLEDVDPNGRNK